MFARPLFPCCAAILILVFPVLPQTQSGCKAKIDGFTSARPIAVLLPREQSAIMALLSPEIRAFQKIGGGDEAELRPERLSKLLYYTLLPTGNPGDRLLVVRFVDETCGAHLNCSAFVLRLDSNGATSVLKGRGPVPADSAGAASLLGILPRAGSRYPDLLFVAHVSAFEKPVSCFTWQGGQYIYTPCRPECAHFLDHPRP